MQEAINTVNTQVLRQLRQELPLGYSINVSGQARIWTAPGTHSNGHSFWRGRDLPVNVLAV